MKKHYIAASLAAGIALVGVSVPILGSAETTSDIQTQIDSLLAKIAELTKEIDALRMKAGETSVGSVIAIPPAPALPPPVSADKRICSVLYRNLAIGIRGDDVRGLQEFLYEKKYLSVEPTGYYGSLTTGAVNKWQASEGITPVGAFGPISRDRIRLWCGGGGICTKEYAPVCGAKPIVCITTPCSPVPTTYENKCMMEADGATYLYAGACRADYPNPADDPTCQAWYDGCNSCSRETPTSPAMCTLRACSPESMTKPYCTAWFDTGNNKPPVISSFSGPTVLGTSEMGTWTVSAKDPENGVLSYSISWGDENAYATPTTGMAADAREFTQTTTFTHSYASAGTYTVTIVVQDNMGLQAKTSMTVNVTGSIACTAIYDPVCGRPAGCANTCPPGSVCPAICELPEPKTYSNTCVLKSEGATYLHEGECTASSGNWY